MAFKGLFIGIDRYASPGVNWLSCAGRDAKALHALFTDSFGGETALLLDDQATVAEIGSRFDALAASDPTYVDLLRQAFFLKTFQHNGAKRFGTYGVIKIDLVTRKIAEAEREIKLLRDNHLFT